MTVLEVIGSDIDHFECPRCGAHDRERHLLLYMRASGILTDLAERSVLHFAPEPRLSPIIEAAGPDLCVRCDLFAQAHSMARVDIQRMPFRERTFDLVIANHVLEHVDDDTRALTEIRRVLKPGGRAILQTPFSRTLARTWEDPGIERPEARLQAFGQSDHVRLFGRDIFARIGAVGFNSEVRAHDDLLLDFGADEWGVNRNEPFFLFRREG